MEISIFKQLIEDKFGIYIDSVRDSILFKAIKQRMELLDLEDNNNYYIQLRKDEEELENLVSLITVNESYFFREKGQLELLTDIVIPDLVTRKSPGAEINILSAGCSTGEEPYSIAITCIERLTASIASRIRIAAFDVDKKVIESAKEGIYGKSSFRTLDEDICNKYFKPINKNQNQIDISLGKKITFFEHNLLKEEFPSNLRKFDVIFYRNVSIYFKPRTQKKVFIKLSELLNPTGYLFMSATETFVHDLGILKLIELSDCFVFQKNTPENPITPVNNTSFQESIEETLHQIHLKSNKIQSDQKSDIPVPSNFENGFLRETDNRSHFNKALELLRFNKEEEALKQIELIESHFPDSKKLNVLKAKVLNQLKRTGEAKAICRNLIERDQWYVWPYLYLGLFAQSENNNDEMVKQLKKAIYIQPSCWLAHYYLAQYYYSIDSINSASREIKNVIRLLDKGNNDLNEVELFLEPINVNKVLSEFKTLLSRLENELKV